MSLYREEVLLARSNINDGGIILTRSISSWVIVAIIITTLLTAVIFLCSASFTKRVKVSGILVPGEGAIPVIAPTSGRILAAHVEEGQLVNKGETLFRVTNDKAFSPVASGGGVNLFTLAQRQTISMDEQRASIKEEKEKVQTLAAQERSAKRRKLEKLHLDYRSVVDQLKFAEQRLHAGQKRLEEYSILNESLVVSNLTVQDQSDAVANLNLQAISYRRQMNEIERAIETLEDEIKRGPDLTNLKILSLDRDLDSLDQRKDEYLAQREWLIQSPIAGRITSLTGTPGQPFSQQILAVVIPENSYLTAHLYVQSRQVGFIATGQQVRIRYQAFPYQKFGQHYGDITSVARSPIPPNSVPATLPLKSDEGIYKVTVRIPSQEMVYHGKKIPLVSGMLIEADIAQEERKLIEWVVEPLYTLTLI